MSQNQVKRVGVYPRLAVLYAHRYFYNIGAKGGKEAPPAHDPKSGKMGRCLSPFRVCSSIKTSTV
jgi:hypothetical protein